MKYRFGVKWHVRDIIKASGGLIFFNNQTNNKDQVSKFIF